MSCYACVELDSASHSANVVDLFGADLNASVESDSSCRSGKFASASSN